MNRISFTHRTATLLIGGASAMLISVAAIAQGASAATNSDGAPGDAPFIATSHASKITASTIPGAAALAVATDWPTFGMNKQRLGYNGVESVLNRDNVSQLHVHWATDIGGPITTQPTLMTGVLVNGRPTDVVYAATWSGRIVALNAATGELIWSVPAPTVQTRCGNFNASGGFVGTIGTPTLDRRTNRMYVVTGYGFLHALDLSTGVDVMPWVQLIDTPSASPKTIVFGSPTLNGSDIYITTASPCDVRPYHGQIVRVSTTTGAILQRWYPTSASGPDGGGIWGPGGVSISPNGLWVYTATGNAFPNAQNGAYAEHVVRLTTSLAVDAANTPPPPNIIDADFGATPLLFQTAVCPPMLAAMQKTGRLYIYNRNTLASGPIYSFQIGRSTPAGNFIGMPAFDPVLNRLYLGNPVDSSSGIVRHGLVALSIQSDCSVAIVWNLSVGVNSAGQNPSISPIVANGVVYYADGIASEVFAVDARSGAQLWSTNNLPVADRVTGGIFTSPTVVNGQLFVAGFDHKIHAYGL
ncbi:outer membrane protein assembly factor BamB family protein [Caballeronia humi]|nr:PQQ-binding-like beta-propeller repeat protein [Caballeronia humi]